MAAAEIQSGVYYIQNYGTGTVLDLTEGSSANGTKIQGHVKHDISDPTSWIPAQLWIIRQIGGDNLYTIQNCNSRTYMDLTGANVKSGTPIIGHQKNDGANQHWKIFRNAAKTAYVIQNVATGTFIDLLNGGSADGTHVNGWAGSGPSTTNPHQLWYIVRA